MTVDPCPRAGLHSLQLADVADVEGAVWALTEAFDRYPWTRWTVPERDHAQRLRGLFHISVSQIGLPFGDVWISRCEATGEIVGTAVAVRPDRVVPPELWQRLAAAEEELMGERLSAAMDAEAACEPMRPAEPHVVLATIGVRRDHQRRGLATALLRQVVSTACSLEVPTYLETSSDVNVEFYQRSGFSIVGSVQVPNGGPTVWGMLRPPRRTISA